METTSGEITLHDLLAWEPRLTFVSPLAVPAGAADPLAREVDWVLTARSSPPMLPFLRGGELIVLPQRIVQETGIPFARLVNEITMQPIAGILTEEPVPAIPDSPLVILSTERIGPETESDLNRLLASRRRELLQSASEVDRLIADALERRVRPAELLDALSQRLRIPISVLTDYGAVLFSTGSGADNVPADARMSREWLSAPLKEKQTLWLGPIPTHNHALMRMTLHRVRESVQRSLDRDATTAPHGTARASALNALLLPHAGLQGDSVTEQAFRAGIAPGRILHVALAPGTVADSSLRRMLAPLGESHEAGHVDGYRAVITVATPAASGRGALPEIPGIPWIAISSPIDTARELPQATRQARYLAALIEASAISEPVVRFSDAARLGVYRLLYDSWGSPLLERFCSTLLADLEQEDRRGLLRETLRIFLEEGGSLRPTAEALGIHRNTLTYRLKQIRSIVEVDLDDPHTRLSLQIALIARQLPDAPV
ncbi:MAG TPA: helix-turn-helix domain-containing protein [Thermomicrobiales bacterium]|nr:helix-turn-helix domain-containing protein [Thermomicrobiales bacterium]